MNGLTRIFSLFIRENLPNLHSIDKVSERLRPRKQGCLRYKSKMVSDQEIRQKLIIWVGAIVLLLLLLAAGLPDLVLDDGAQYASNWRLTTIVGEINILPFVYAALLIIILMLAIYLRRRTWTNFGRTMLVILLTLGACGAFISLAPEVEMELPVEEEVASEEEEPLPTPESLDLPGEPELIVELDAPEPVPDWVTLLVGAMVAFVVLMLVVGMLYTLLRLVPQAPPSASDEPLQEVGRQAQTAVIALKKGKPLRDVVLRCYADMEQAVRTTQGLEREQTMTVREFEQQLLRLGLPAAAVGTLIHLFEQVRYGRYTPQPDDQAQAIHSLTQIMAATGEEATP